MKEADQKNASRTRRIARIRAKVQGTSARPRLAVRRSLKHMYAQLIDDTCGVTLVSATDTEITSTKEMKRTEVAAAVGKLLAERAMAKQISQVIFDRRDKQYHGRVKAVAEGARSAGLVF